ncbi:MAG: peptidoglycan DD-metalloendopeptidase family protein [Gammaproteobacteria bacterium]|nr:peptidoglycan DD-metalloendopeptidase family protein [Gammaproteobacteria bacterium]
MRQAFLYFPRQRLRLFALPWLVVLLNACGGHLYHVVEPGETLYSIGWAYGYDYQQIAQWNGIKPPYQLSPGQHLRVAPGGSIPARKKNQHGTLAAPVRVAPVAKVRVNPAPVVRPRPATEFAKPIKKTVPGDGKKTRPVETSASDANGIVVAVKKLFNVNTLGWRWPTEERRVLRTFSAKDAARQGLNVAGNMGDPVYAAAAGQVVYAGSGLARYGQLIIVKHNQKYLSAYAHNNVLRVKEGERVKAGQRIADMGRSGTGNSKKSNKNGSTRAVLHFEIRYNGKPVDPMKYLPKP